jgi:hypothetical protein
MGADDPGWQVEAVVAHKNHVDVAAVAGHCGDRRQSGSSPSRSSVGRPQVTGAR